MTTNSSNKLAIQIAQNLKQGAAVALAGFQALGALREAIAAAGVTLEFDPESDPRLRDYLASAVAGGATGAVAGAAVGLTIGLMAERPAEGAAIGLAIGALLGILAGIDRVDEGWRIRVTWLDREPRMLVKGMESTWS